MPVPQLGDDWCELTASELPISQIYDWAVTAQCGAVVLFSGTVRDHADGRSDVTSLEYEAYEDAVVPVFQNLAHEARQQFNGIGRIAILHRTGLLQLEESSVVVAVSSPHRGLAFEAARFLIDSLKTSAPIWKKENWAGGSDWGTGAHDVVATKKVSESSQ